VRVPEKWRAGELCRAINAILPEDVWVCSAFEMREDFHPRYSATSRTYRYFVGTDAMAPSPFRSRTELCWQRPLDPDVLSDSAARIVGSHSFRGFAVKGTAPETDNHRCTVERAQWTARPGGLQFEIRANRFLHHMVRFLVGTMLEAATGKRDASDVSLILDTEDNSRVSPPAPAHALFLESVEYPSELYLDTE
jgi:tRNA pseudouridine38-40 synthase